MATAGGGKLYKRLFSSEMNEEPQNVSHEGGRNYSTGAFKLSTHQGGDFASIGISELELILKHKTFTRSETQRLITLLHSKTIEESPSPVKRLEASKTSKKQKHGDESDNFHASIVGSRVLEEEIASSAELAKAYISTSQTPRQDLKTPMASQHSVTMENLPDELLVNIFTRLFAKQLAQMRSVSKSWNALLSQSSFVKSHLHHSIHNNDQVLLVFHDKLHRSHDNKQFTAKPCQSPHLELTNFIKLPVNPQSEYTNGIMIIGSINGLICSCYGDSVIQIWNPSLSAVLTLPPYSTPSHLRIHFRFGFDPQTDDYKVVKLTGITGPYINAIKWWLQVEVYSLRKGTWELITERFPSHITYISDEDYVCVDGHEGHLHWLCCVDEKMDSKRIIVAFDLGSETFREMPLPIPY